MSETPFFAIKQEVIDKCQEELSKIKVLNYTTPDIDPTDEPYDPTDDPGDKAEFMKFNSLILCLIILFCL